MINQKTNNHNTLSSIMIMGLEEILGEEALNVVLEKAFHDKTIDDPLTQFIAVQESLETIYSPRGGMGLALQAGRSSFDHILRLYGKQMGMLGHDYRMLTTPRRIHTGMIILVNTLHDLGAMSSAIDETDKFWIWTATRCMSGHVRQEGEPACYFFIGVLQEYLYWASGGRYYQIKEIECTRSGGQACVFHIGKIPLD